ncbi:MAG: DUF2520 domain-containing protein [Dehalococcoidia bacterium]|nr:DUF2520 domain-containing protein [Dehalococcoidia bacterium]MSQ17732.1 DUF2520 domain-containing protein [Dehalococcoidia bacterium]
MASGDRTIGFIGVGVLAKGLALALAQLSYPVTGAYSRSFSSAQELARRLPGCKAFTSAQELAGHAGLVFITTPDAAIGPVAASLSWRRGQGVVHCSGALTLEVLRPAADGGASVGGFHPFQTFAGLDDPAEAAARLQGVSFAVAGQGWVLEHLTQMAAALGGRAVSIPDAERPLYHASAILACGYLAALLQGAASLWQEMGFPEQQAMRALQPLAQTTLDNVFRHGVVPNVTGPVVRGDVATVRAHLEALSQRLPELVPLYAALTRESLSIAERRGVGPEQLASLRAAVDFYDASKVRG